MTVIEQLRKLKAEATQDWMQAHHIDEPRALVSSSQPMVSLLGLDKDDMAIFDRLEDCVVAVAAVNHLDALLDVAQAARDYVWAGASHGEIDQESARVKLSAALARLEQTK